MKQKMLAAVLYGEEELRVEPVALPRIGPSDVLVKVRVALTCGTDLKVFRRGYHARMIQPPAILGHELAGDIVAVGSEVQDFRTGQRVVAANSAPCWNCYYCRHKQENLCENLLFNNGAYAEYARIPGPIVRCNTHEVPEGIDYREAALIEPLACVLRALEATQVRVDDTLAVMGLGPIGLMFVRLAKLKGARVLAVGRRQTQLDRAERMGADELVLAEPGADPVKAVRCLTGGSRGADIVIEAVGAPETWQAAVAMVRSGGIVNLFGGCPSESTISVDTSQIHYSEITLQSSFHHTPTHILKALDIICRKQLQASDFVIDEAPLADLLRVFRQMMSHNGHLKTAILP